MKLGYTAASFIRVINTALEQKKQIVISDRKSYRHKFRCLKHCITEQRALYVYVNHFYVDTNAERKL